MNAIGATVQQKPGDADEPSSRDNLHEPRSNGAVLEPQDVHARRTSLLLEAQKHPIIVVPAAFGAVTFPVRSKRLLYRKKNRRG